MNFTTFSPPFRIVGGYFICGLTFLLLSIFGFFVADFDAVTSLKTAGFVHIFLIGFVISIIVGALYQLTSVIIQKPFFSVKFAFANLFVFALGLAILSAGMFGEKLALLHAGGAVLLLGLMFFAITYALSFISTPTWTFPAFALLISAFYLIIGIVLGFVLILIVTGSVSLDFSLFLALHIYFVGGFMFLVIVGAACVLIPMFSLAHNLSFLCAKISVVLYLLGGFFVGSKFSFWFFVFSFAFFGAQAVYILARRVRRAFDYWNANIYFSIVCAGLGAIFWFLGKEDNAIFAIFYGFLYAFICAHLYKIAPFLIWYHYVSPFVGKGKIPLLEDMIIKNLAYVALGANIVATLLIALNLSKFALGFMALSIVLVIINITNVFKYTKFGVSNESK